MARARKKAAGKNPASGAARSLSGDLAATLLEVHRELELGPQLRLLMEQALARSGARLAFVFAPSENRRWLVPTAASVVESDPRYRALQRVDPARLGEWLPGASERFDGLGPLVKKRVWPGEGGGASLVLRVAAEDGALAGLVWLVFADKRVPPAADDVLELFELVRPAVGNALKLQAMRDLVIKDDTALCFNRRHFEEFLPEELARASRFRAPLSLIFFDLDNLKQVNSDYGHAMGSRTLREVSVRVRGKIRKFDKLFRFGGDEFCVVLPETEWHGALEVAERVREAVAGQPFPVVLAGEGEAAVSMTASFGIASFPLHARDKEELVQQADRAMQRVKKDSKNAVGVAEIVANEHGS